MGTARLSLALALLIAGCGRAPPPAAAPPRKPPPTPSSIEPGPDPDFPEKGPPEPGDWLDRFAESGQTVAQYRWACTNRKAPDRRTLVIQPLGEAGTKHGKVLDQVRACAAAFFDVEAILAEALPLPRDAFDGKRGQYDGDRILLDLGNRLPGMALAYVGFCAESLWSEDLAFVFGVASLNRRTGVWSLALCDGDGEATLLRRALKIGLHESCHILCMQHCVRWECLMNGSNSRREMDARPLFLCPPCHEKLRWNTGFDPAKRYAALADFFDGAGLSAEAAFARRQAARVPTESPVATAR